MAIVRRSSRAEPHLCAIVVLPQFPAYNTAR
jgi:hypothetical protein